MAIKYYLQPNPVTPDPADQSARVAPNTTLDLNALVSKIIKRGTLVTETDAKAVLNVFFDVVSDEVADGNSVLLPIVNIRPSITGVFSSATDSFDHSRHVKKASLSAGVLLNQKVSSAAVEKITSSVPNPVLLEYADINSQTVNSKITPGGIGQIVGEELKFDPASATEGIFLISSNGTETKITILATRTEGKLMFSIPAGLAAGSYSLEVRKGYGNSGTLRTGALADALQVA